METNTKNTEANNTKLKREKKPKVIDVEKKVYCPEEIMVMLGLSRTTTYQFLNKVYKDQSPFRVIKVNTVLRVPKEGFDAWLKIVS